MNSFITENANNILFAGSVFVGMLGHYTKKKLKDGITETVWEWFGHVNATASINTIITAGTIIVGALSHNLTEGMSLSAAIYAGLMQGYAVDSVMNNGDAPTTENNVDAPTT